jgi:cytidylate kinase
VIAAGAGKSRRRPIIAIDGPAGAGKTTTAREVARRLGFLHLDTGAMYRALALKVIKSRGSLEDPAGIARIAAGSVVWLQHDNNHQRVLLDGSDVTSQIRSAEVTKAVTPVCEVPEVREQMVQLQRKLGQQGGVVVEGRDIGTVVFPDAELKIFLTADLPERALRRLKELKSTKRPAELPEVMEAIRRRDQRDAEREHSPLKQAAGAIFLDTTRMTFEQQVEAILAYFSQLEA